MQVLRIGSRRRTPRGRYSPPVLSLFLARHEDARRPVSRVLSPPRTKAGGGGWPFIWDVRYRTPRATDPDGGAETRPAEAHAAHRPAVPTWSCSRWGLPCRRRCRRRGALLPHPFTLAGRPEGPGRRFAFCGTFPGVAPAGDYPAPCFRGARTFLPRPTTPGARRPKAAIRPSGSLEGSRAGGNCNAALRRHQVSVIRNPAPRLFGATDKARVGAVAVRSAASAW